MYVLYVTCDKKEHKLKACDWFYEMGRKGCWEIWRIKCESL